jgi:hypothetical protein
MMGIRSITSPLAAVALAFAGLVLPTIASAQDLPSYAQPLHDETIQGRIVSINGTFNISVRDERGFIDNVELHQGTIINPTGLTLETGMTVTIVGVNSGSAFEANEIDTPYHYYGALPEPVYLGPGYWYPGFGYGYGPSFSLGLVVGNGFSFEHRPFYGHPFYGHPFYGRPGWGGHAWEQHPVPRGPQNSAQVRAVEPVGRAPQQGAWRTYDTSRSGYTAPSSGATTTRAYGSGESRAYGSGGSRAYGSGESRAYGSGGSRGSGGESRGVVRTYAAPSVSSGMSHGGGGRGPH